MACSGWPPALAFDCRQIGATTFGSPQRCAADRHGVRGPFRGAVRRRPRPGGRLGVDTGLPGFVSRVEIGPAVGPWAALRSGPRLLRPQGRIVVSDGGVSAAALVSAATVMADRWNGTLALALGALRGQRNPSVPVAITAAAPAVSRDRRRTATRPLEVRGDGGSSSGGGHRRSLDEDETGRDVSIECAHAAAPEPVSSMSSRFFREHRASSS